MFFYLAADLHMFFMSTVNVGTYFWTHYDHNSVAQLGLLQGDNTSVRLVLLTMLVIFYRLCYLK